MRPSLLGIRIRGVLLELFYIRKLETRIIYTKVQNCRHQN